MADAETSFWLLAIAVSGLTKPSEKSVWTTAPRAGCPCCTCVVFVAVSVWNLFKPDLCPRGRGHQVLSDQQKDPIRLHFSLASLPGSWWHSREWWPLTFPLCISKFLIFFFLPKLSNLFCLEINKCFLIIGSQSGIGFNGGALKTSLYIWSDRPFTIRNRSACEEEETPNIDSDGRMLRVVDTVFIGLYFTWFYKDPSHFSWVSAYGISSIKLRKCQMEAGIYLLFKLSRAGCSGGAALLVDWWYLECQTLGTGSPSCLLLPMGAGCQE